MHVVSQLGNSLFKNNKKILCRFKHFYLVLQHWLHFLAQQLPDFHLAGLGHGRPLSVPRLPVRPPLRQLVHPHLLHPRVLLVHH